MTFYVKQPGEYEGEPIGRSEQWEHVGSLDATVEDWALYLPHQCNAWEIGHGTREETLAEARQFRDGLDAAIRFLEAAGVEEPPG